MKLRYVAGGDNVGNGHHHSSRRRLHAQYEVRMLFGFLKRVSSEYLSVLNWRVSNFDGDERELLLVWSILGSYHKSRLLPCILRILVEQYNRN